MKYRFAGKEKKLSIGVYPDVSLDLEGRSEIMQWYADYIDELEHNSN